MLTIFSRTTPKFILNFYSWIVKITQVQKNIIIFKNCLQNYWTFQSCMWIWMANVKCKIPSVSKRYFWKSKTKTDSVRNFCRFSSSGFSLRIAKKKTRRISINGTEWITISRYERTRYCAFYLKTGVRCWGFYCVSQENIRL